MQRSSTSKHKHNTVNCGLYFHTNTIWNKTKTHYTQFDYWWDLKKGTRVETVTFEGLFLDLFLYKETAERMLRKWPVSPVRSMLN